MEEALQWISKEYPPGKGLDAEKKHLEEALKNLEQKKEFVHEPSKLNSSENKQTQLEKIILNKALIAKRSRDCFEELIR